MRRNTDETKFQREIVEAAIPSLLNDAIDWICSNLEPDDVFSDTQLDMWAKDNGYVPEDADA